MMHLIQDPFLTDKSWRPALCQGVRETYFIDLFSGCGGFSFGLASAGLRGLFAIERDEMAFRTFESNFLSEAGFLNGLFKWPGWLEKVPWPIEDLLAYHEDNLMNLRGVVDVIVGGPPCQGFSFAGKRNADDPRNNLFLKYVRVVDCVRPFFVVLENVPGMDVAHRNHLLETSKKNKKSYFEQLRKKLISIGYEVGGRIVNLVDYGVPQKRNRLIVFGVRKDAAYAMGAGPDYLFQLLDAARAAQLRNLGLRVPVAACEALSDLETNKQRLEECDDLESPKGFMQLAYVAPESLYQELMQLGPAEFRMNSMRLARHTDVTRERFKLILARCARGTKIDDETRNELGLNKHRLVPMAADEPAPTITTLPDDVLHYSEPRILTVRECARLQSFPDWFVFRGKFTTGGARRTKECPRYTQVGNAVPPLLSRAIGVALRAAVKEVRLFFGEAIGLGGHGNCASGVDVGRATSTIDISR